MTEFVQDLVPWVAGAVIIMLFIDVLLTIIKLVRGPSVLNRALAADLLVSTLICAIGAEMVLSRHSWSLPLLVTLALVAFVGTVAVSRFVARDSDSDNNTDGMVRIGRDSGEDAMTKVARDNDGAIVRQRAGEEETP